MIENKLNIVMMLNATDSVKDTFVLLHSIHYIWHYIIVCLLAN